MTDSADAGTPNQLWEEFRRIAEEYNAAIRAGKIRAIRIAAAKAHQEIFALSRIVQAQAHHPGQSEVISDIEAAYMDVRWGRAIVVVAR